MTFDDSFKATQERLAAQLKEFRGDRSVPDVAKNVNIVRDTIYKIESGRVSSLKTVAKLLWEYDRLTLDDLIYGFREKDIPKDQQEDHRKLKEVLASGISGQVDLVRLAIETAYAKVQELKARQYQEKTKALAEKSPPARKQRRA